MKVPLDKDLIPLVYFQNDAAVVRQTKDRGRQCGWTETQTAQGTLSPKTGPVWFTMIQRQLSFLVLSAGGGYFRTLYRTRHEDGDDGDCRRSGTRTVLTFAYSDCGPLLFYPEIRAPLVPILSLSVRRITCAILVKLDLAEGL